MTEQWIGKAVSIYCRGELGIFQGTIKSANSKTLTVVRAFRNGVPLQQQDMEVTFNVKDITKLELISCYSGSSFVPTNYINKPTPIKHPNFEKKSIETNEANITNKLNNLKVNNKVSPPNNNNINNGSGKSNKYLSKSPSNSKNLNHQTPTKNESKSNGLGSLSSTSKPIDITHQTRNGIPSTSNSASSYNNNHNGTNNFNNLNINNNKNDKKKSRRFNIKNSAFGTPIDDSNMDEDFDFEKNLSLFDKQAIWDEIDANSSQKPDLVRQTVQNQKKKYRHDENILLSEPTQLRQIQVEFDSSLEFVTDEGLIIPCIPRNLRNRVQELAVSHGYTMERQNDMLARSATELCIQLLGGARRLIPKNQHQWPKCVVICDEPYNDPMSEIGISTARQLASHGLKVMVYVKTTTTLERVSKELELYTATGNDFTISVNDLPSADLVILAVKSIVLPQPITKWINDNRGSVFAIDPPVSGFQDITVKCAILPILPVDKINPNMCKFYLCNLGIPSKFYRDSGIKYKSPFNKYVIPIHVHDD